MRKVTTINLNGRAYQVEEDGYEKLRTYLRRAEAALVGDPDKSEVLADIEQAIADKCSHVLKPGKNVVTTDQIVAILDDMGEVEGEGGAAANNSEPAEPDASKRLFVIRDGALLMGVCRGLGAYFGIDPTLIRLGFVVLTLATSGIWILVYIILGLVLPTAKTEADLSEAYGKPVTAQAIVDRARERVPSPEAWKHVSDVLIKALRIIAKVARVVLAVAFGVLTAAWLVMVWSLLFGRFNLYDQLQVLNGWRSLLAVTAVYLIVALPVFVLSRVSDRLAESRDQSRVSFATEGSLSALWGISWVVLVVLGVTYAQNFRDYSATHQGYLDIGSSRVCVDTSRCNPDNQFDYPTSLPKTQQVPLRMMQGL